MSRIALAITVAIAGLFAGCSHQDPIDRLMAKLPYDKATHTVGVLIDLPQNASAEQCISVLTKRGTFSIVRILEVRQTHTKPHPEDGIPIQNYTAVLLDDSGREIIILLQQVQDKSGFRGWSSEMFDAKTVRPTNTIQRMRASRSAQSQLARPRRLARTA
jgi:hypothetical protein